MHFGYHFIPSDDTEAISVSSLNTLMGYFNQHGFSEDFEVYFKTIISRNLTYFTGIFVNSNCIYYKGTKIITVITDFLFSWDLDKHYITSKIK